MMTKTGVSARNIAIAAPDRMECVPRVILIGLTVRTDNKWNNASPTERIVGVPEWTRGIVVD